MAHVAATDMEVDAATTDSSSSSDSGSSSRFLSLGPLPLDLVTSLLVYLDPPSLFRWAEAGAWCKKLVDDGDPTLWPAWADRHIGRFRLPSSALTSALTTATAAATATATAATASSGRPHPLLALFGDGFRTLDLAVPPSRRAFAAFYALRRRAIRECLLPLQPQPQPQQPQPQAAATPCLVSQYFHAYDSLAALGACDGDAADAILAEQLRVLRSIEEEQDGMMAVVPLPVASGRAAALPVPMPMLPPPLAPIALLLAMHALYRAVGERGPAEALGGWRRHTLRALAKGPFLGMAAVAYWTMGSHNPYGFRARDVLRTEKVDLRQLAHQLLVMAEGSSQTTGSSSTKPVAIPSTEASATTTTKKGDDDGGVGRLLARLESLRGIMPVSALDPPVVYIDRVEREDAALAVNDRGYYQLSQSPPRR